jgi:hypothetical protein
MEHGQAARVGEVESDAPLVAVERLEIEAVAIADRERSDVACRIAAVARALDLDDVRTEVAEQRRRERAGAELTNRQDANAVERQTRILHAAGVASARRARNTRGRLPASSGLG